MRAYSPNNRARGHWDFDAAETERENTFTPAFELPAGPFRTASPLPEPGSLEAMMCTSLCGPHLPSPDLALFTDIPAFRNNLGIRRHEVQSFVERFRVLPLELQELVIVEQRQNDLFWMDALCRVEDQPWWLELGPAKRRIFQKVKNIHENSIADVEIEERAGRNLIRIFSYLITHYWPLNENAVVWHYLQPLRRDGEERGEMPGRDHRSVYKYSFWYFAIELMDEWLGCRPDWRPVAVSRLLNLKRIAQFEVMAEISSSWMKRVGDSRSEIDSVYEAGDFWEVWEYWEDELDPLEDKYSKMSWDEAKEASLYELQVMITNGDWDIESDVDD